MKLTVLTLLSTAAIVGLAWSQDPNADNTEKNTRDRDDQSQTAAINQMILPERTY